VNGDGDYNSGNFTPTATGTYLWTAAYTGDLHNKGSSTACGDANETSVVNKANSSTATLIHDADHNVILSAPIGSVVHDRAAVTGTAAGGTPTGNVTFTVYLGKHDLHGCGDAGGDGQPGGWCGASERCRDGARGRALLQGDLQRQ
jgi:hypothetical protein